MSKHLLHAAQIGPVRKQVRSESMPQHMRRHPRRIETGRKGDFPQLFCEPVPRHMPVGGARRK